MEEPQLLRIVLPGGQDQVVASQTQGPLNGRIERSVKHHIVHPWGLNQLRKLHGPQQLEPRDCGRWLLRRRTGEENNPVQGWPEGRGPGRGGRAPPQTRVGSARPAATVTGCWKSGIGQAGALLPHLPVLRRPRTRPEGTLRDRPSSRRRKLETWPG